jgi:magnesium transporter
MGDNILTTKEYIELFEQSTPADIAQNLKKIRKHDKELFDELLHLISDEVLGDVLLELPENLRDKAYEVLSIEELQDAIEELESDDATDIIKDIEEIDSQKADEILDGLDEEDQEDINWLKKYEDDQAGAFMQTELFSANIDENIQVAIDRLRVLKAQGELENIHQVFVVDDEGILLCSISLEDLIIFDFSKTFREILENQSKEFKSIAVEANDDIQDVVKIFEDYDLSVVAVVYSKK